MLDMREKILELEEKVVDHYHYSDRIIAYKHSDCNIQRQSKKVAPIVAHNLRKNDLHHLRLALHVCSTINSIKISPQTYVK